MSRSVKQDYPPKTGGTPIIPKLQKFGAITMVSDEQLFTLLSYRDKRYLRKANKIITLPTQEMWEWYRAAVAGLQALEAYEFTEWGGPDYGTEVLEPQPKTTYEYLETHDEWMARCRELRKETT
jgi:hypothetical protein